MIDLHLTTDKGRQTFRVPTGWKDISTETFLRMEEAKGDPDALLSLLTGMPPGYLAQIRPADRQIIDGLCAFVQDTDLLEAEAHLAGHRYPLTRALLSFSKMEQARHILKVLPGVPLLRIAAHWLCLYAETDVFSQPIPKVFADLGYVFSEVRERMPHFPPARNLN